MPSNLDNIFFEISQAIEETLLTQSKGFAPNNHIKDAIFTTIDRVGDGSYVITVSVDTPDARAYEFGSGIHSQEGVAETYVIEPKNAKMLAFFWEKASDKLPHLPDGRVILSKVNHPGVEAANGGQGYLRPAIEIALSQLEQYSAMIAQEITNEIMDAAKLK